MCNEPAPTATVGVACEVILWTDDWLGWQAHQLDMPCLWTELTAIPGEEDPQKFSQKIWASFSIPEVRSRVFLGQDYTTSPAPKCLTQSVFIPDELSYQDVWQQPFLLTVPYAWGLQYWAERLNLPEDPDFCPLVRSVIQLREWVKEHVIFTKWDIIQGLVRFNPVATSQWPQTSPTGFGRVDPPLSPCVTMVPSTRFQVDDWPVKQNASFMEATTQTTSPTISGVKLTRPIALLNRTEEENQYVLVMTTLIR